MNWHDADWYGSSGSYRRVMELPGHVRHGMEWQLWKVLGRRGLLRTASRGKAVVDLIAVVCQGTERIG